MTFFWSDIGSGFREQGGTPQPRIPTSTPQDCVNVLVFEDHFERVIILQGYLISRFFNKTRQTRKFPAILIKMNMAVDAVMATSVTSDMTDRFDVIPTKPEWKQRF